MSNSQLGVFAKYWQPGKVKTRLAASLGDERAAAVYLSCLRAIARRYRQAADQCIVQFTPDGHRTDFHNLFGDAWQLAPQCNGDLGDRMRHYFETAHSAGFQREVLIGSDSPNLPQNVVSQAFDLLDQHEVVLGPCEDGGYYLIGVAGDTPDLFRGIRWSSPQVLSETRARIEQSGIQHAELEEYYDIDTSEDLQRLVTELDTSPKKQRTDWQEILRSELQSRLV